MPTALRKRNKLPYQACNFIIILVAPKTVHVHRETVPIPLPENANGTRPGETGFLTPSLGLRRVSLHDVPELEGIGSTDAKPILGRRGTRDGEAAPKGKGLLVRIVALLPRMIERGTHVREGEAGYGNMNKHRNEGKRAQQRVQAARHSSRLTPRRSILGIRNVVRSG